MIDSDLCGLTISRAAKLIAGRKLTSTALTLAVLERLEVVQPRFQPYATVMRDDVLDGAQWADAEIAAGTYKGPLHGIPLGVKDVIDVAGAPTRCGSQASPDSAAKNDAGVIARLRQAGALMLGKTVTHEYAFGSSSPPSRCAWDVDAVPGGSSGGSAVAVAHDVAFAGLGTDTGSSVRNPAALNGVVGLKPTYGRVGRSGVVPCSWTCDHVGLISKTVEDAALVLHAMSGLDPHDATSVDRPLTEWSPDQDSAPHIAGLRLGVPSNYFFDGVRDDVLAVVEDAISTLRQLGAIVVPVTVPAVEYSFAVATVLVIVEGASLHRCRLRERGHLFSEPVRDFLSTGQLLFGTAYVDAQRVRSLIADGLRRTFANHRLSALVTPTSPLGAVPVGQDMVSIAGEDPQPVMGHYARLTCPFNLSGLPALTVPCGFDADRHPVGLQIAGRPFDEDTVLRIGYAFQEGTTWHHEHPPLEAASPALAAITEGPA